MRTQYAAPGRGNKRVVAKSADVALPVAYMCAVHDGRGGALSAHMPRSCGGWRVTQPWAWDHAPPHLARCPGRPSACHTNPFPTLFDPGTPVHRGRPAP